MEQEKKITVPAKLSQLKTVMAFLEETLQQHNCPVQVLMKVAIVFEEIFVNIANYAYGTTTGECTVSITVRQLADTAEATIQLSDKGVPFNPMEKEDPDITLSADERPIGGLGIYMTKKTMDHISYEYENGENRLTMVKTWETD